jgi:tRNA1(Val) A37 N6-methylase TrmN6
MGIGSSPELIIKLLKNESLAKSLSILDLSCGNGAVSISLAKSFEVDVFRVNLFEPSIVEAESEVKINSIENNYHFAVNGIKKEVIHSYLGVY